MSVNDIQLAATEMTHTEKQKNGHSDQINNTSEKKRKNYIPKRNEDDVLTNGMFIQSLHPNSFQYFQKKFSSNVQG